MVNTLLITGVSGLLGQAIAIHARDTWSVHGLHYEHAIDLTGVTGHRVDLRSSEALRSLIQTLRPDAIIHCAALSQPGICEAEPERSRAINICPAIDLASYANETGIPFAFTSTDLVFDGTSAPYNEEAPPRPLSVYGRHKVEAETAVLDRCAHALVCRLPLLYGTPAPTGCGFPDFIIGSLRKRQECRLFIDEFRSVLSADCAARGLLQFVATHTGLLHLGGPESLSRHTMGVQLANVLDLDNALIEAIQQRDLELKPPRPANVSLDSSLAFSLGFRPLPFSAGIRHLAPLL